MRALVVVVTLLTVVAPIAGAAAAFPVATEDGESDTTTTDDVTITVTVVDTNGDGVDGATVTVSWEGGSATEQTAGNGKTFVTVPDDERLEISVDHPEYVQNFPLTVTNVAEDQEVTVDVTRPGTETVRVSDEDGDPVEDARVSLIKDNEVRSVADGRTDAGGVFTAEGIERGQYRIQVLKSGFDQERVSVDVTGFSEHNVTIRSNRTRVNFRVTDGRLGEGVQARVSVRNGGEEVLSFRTGENGRAQQLLAVNSRYTVVVQRDGYRETSQSFRVNQRSTSVALTINRTDDLSLSADTTQVLAGNSIRVTVTDEYDDPVEGATVSLAGESVATTGPNGEATVRVEEPGTYNLTASDEDVVSDPVEVRAVSAATTTARPTTTAEPTTAEPTTAEPTTAVPTTAEPTTAEPTATATAAGTTAGDGGGGAPGFLVGTALAGLLVGLFVLRRRR